MRFKYIYTFLLILFIYNICSAQTLHTPKGTVIKGINRSEYTQSEIAFYTAEAKANYPNATVLSDASRVYNCHSYAWNLTSGGSIYCWVNQNENGNNISNYWQDGSYKESSEAVAEKIFYYEGDHSAVRSSVGGKYESKWGGYPLMRHDPNYGPADYHMNKRRYYVRNVNIGGNSLILRTGTTLNITNSGTFISPTNWEYSSNLEPLTISNSSITFKSSTNGSGWVRAKFNGYTTKDFTVWTGTPIISSIEGERRIPAGQYASFEAKYDLTSSPTNFQWILNPSSGGTIYGANSAFADIAFYNSGTYQLVVRATNANGVGEYHVTGCNVYNSNSNYSYKIYPNPARDILFIDLSEIVLSQNSELSTVSGSSFKISLFSENGSLMRHTESMGSNLQFNVANLKEGIYYLRIDNLLTKEMETQKVIIRH